MAVDILTITGLRAHYHGIKALHGVDLSVKEGSITAVIGPNGAGKSTMLNVVSGVVAASAGSVSLEKRELTGMKADAIARLGVLQVPEGRRILAPLSVEENLLLGQLALGRRSSVRAYTLDSVYQLFSVLKDKRAQQAGSLSGGQQQMLAVGRALMGNPRILMLDEPSLGLAPVIVDDVFKALIELNRNGLSLLLVEQNARRALEMSSYVYVLDQGAVVRHGPSRDLANDQSVLDHYLGQDRRYGAKPGIHPQENDNQTDGHSS